MCVYLCVCWGDWICQLYVCVCACMCVCVCVCKYVCVCCFVCVYSVCVCVHACVGVCMCVFVYTSLVRNVIFPVGLLSVCCKRVYVFAHICVCTCACVCMCAFKFCNQGSSWKIVADNRHSSDFVDSRCIWSEEIVDWSRWLYWPSQCTTAVVELHLAADFAAGVTIIPNSNFWSIVYQFIQDWLHLDFILIQLWVATTFSRLSDFFLERQTFIYGIHFQILSLLKLWHCSDSLLSENWDAIFGKDCTQCLLLWER